MMKTTLSVQGKVKDPSVISVLLNVSSEHDAVKYVTIVFFYKLRNST